MPYCEEIFATDNPVQLVKQWLKAAEKSEPDNPNAISLATIDMQGMPNIRVVLLKDIEDDGFVFYTNYESQKAQEIEHSQRAAFVAYWKTLRRQIRVRGLVEKEDGPPADDYFASRLPLSRLGAWASKQSRPLASRNDLLAEVAQIKATKGETIQRPPHWGGFRVRPLEIEFWAEGEARLHDRFQWTRTKITDNVWSVDRLYP